MRISLSCKQNRFVINGQKVQTRALKNSLLCIKDIKKSGPLSLSHFVVFFVSSFRCKVCNFTLLSELPHALVFRQICSFLNFFGGRNMLCADEKIIGRV